MTERFGPLPVEDVRRTVLTLQKGPDGRLRLLPRPPPPEPEPAPEPVLQLADAALRLAPTARVIAPPAAPVAPPAKSRRPWFRRLTGVRTHMAEPMQETSAPKAVPAATVMTAPPAPVVPSEKSQAGWFRRLTAVLTQTPEPLQEIAVSPPALEPASLVIAPPAEPAAPTDNSHGQWLQRLARALTEMPEPVLDLPDEPAARVTDLLAPPAETGEAIEPIAAASEALEDEAIEPVTEPTEVVDAAAPALAAPLELVTSEEEEEEPEFLQLPHVVIGTEEAPAPAARKARLIDFQAVTVRYGKETALEEFSFSIDGGELVALVGPSGAGKTTALRLLQGIVRPTKGKLWIDGVPIHRAWDFRLRRLRRRIGVVYQDYRLLPNRSALDNVAFAIQVADLTIPRSEAKRLAKQHLAAVGLAGKEKARPDQLSGGQQQRLAIARALVTKPRILLADEPAASLDPTQARRVMRLLEEIAEAGTTVVLATHQQALVAKTGARILTLNKGRLVSERYGNKKLRVVQ